MIICFQYLMCLNNPITCFFNCNICIEPIKEYIDSKFEQLEISIGKQIESMRRSISYDINAKLNTLTEQLLAKNPKTSLSDARKKIGLNLPIKNLQDFHKFEESLDEDEMLQAVYTFFRIVAQGQTKANGCIARIMTQLLSKDVEVKYSGAGKQIKGAGKLNFSATKSFKILEGINTYMNHNLVY